MAPLAKNETIITVHIPPELKYQEADASKRKGFTLIKKAEISRNQKCPCGSGKKFKHCHMR